MKMPRTPKWARVATCAAALTAGVAINGALFTRLAVNHEIREDLMPYVDQNLAQIMQEQEKTLGITHEGMPNIAFTIEPLNSLISGLGGEYFPGQDTIQIYAGRTVLEEQDSTANRISRFLNPGEQLDIKEVLDHELGHFHVDNVLEELKGGDYSLLRQANLGFMLVNEGIGKYFENKMNGKETEFEGWPESTRSLWNKHVQYTVGCHLVEPIIDQYGDKGIRYLVENFPDGKDLMDLPGYQQRALDYLSGLEPSSPGHD